MALNAVIGLCGSTAVTLTGVGADLGVLDRRKIRTRESQPYHEAQGLPIDKAERLIAEAMERAIAQATHDLGALVDELRTQDVRVVGSAIAFKHYRLASSLAARLRSHAMCHGAEGEMTRDALSAGCEALGLHVYVAPFDVIDPRTEAAAKAIGAPWRKEHKQAASAALAALPDS
jgi:hypothetical protein